MLFARSREGEHGSSHEWSFRSELTLSRQRQKERDFRVILRGVLMVVLRVAFRKSWDWSFKSFLQNLSLVELRPDGDLILEDRRHGFYGGKSGEHL